MRPAHLGNEAQSETLNMELKQTVSVVIPVFNECESIAELHKELTEVLITINRPYEIIFVDDGSSDGSLQVCMKVIQQDEHACLVTLRRHFGKSAALSAGFQAARGDIIITMDGDLQDDPNEIPRLIAALGEGVDLVSGWKRIRKDPIAKRFPSLCINHIVAKITGMQIHDMNCGLKAYRRETVEHLDLYGDLHRYIPVLANAKGFRFREIAVIHHARRYGKSKYGFSRLFRGFFDLLTTIFLSTYQYRPLHLFGLIGVTFAGIGFGIDLYLSYLWFAEKGVIGNRPLLMLGTLMIILGIQILIFGLLAEMITASTYNRRNISDLVHKVFRQNEKHEVEWRSQASDQYRDEGTLFHATRG